MTTQRMQLTVSPRAMKGRKVSRLRNEGILPGNVYGQGKDSVAVELNHKAFVATYKQVGETGLIDLQIEGAAGTLPVLVDDVMVHPISGVIIHVTFHEVNLKEKVTATIPVETIGESEAVKAGGVLVMAFNDIEVEALPAELPEKFEVDLSKLKAVGDDIKVSDLDYDRSKVELQNGVEQDTVLATVQAPKEEEAPAETETPAEVEILKGATTEEGKAGTEGGDAAPAKE